MVKLNNTLTALISCYLVLLQVHSGWCQVRAAVVQIAHTTNGFLCGGTLVSTTRAITAAHCIPTGTLPAALQVRRVDVPGAPIIPTAWNTHPNYDASSRDYDVAVITIPVSAGAVADLCASSWQHGFPMTAHVWSLPTVAAAAVAPTLNSLSMNVYAREWCRIKYPNKVNVNHIRMFCGRGDQNTCFRDRGGPIEINGQFCGIISFGFTCMNLNTPGVFINTGSDGLLDWVRAESLKP